MGYKVYYVRSVFFFNYFLFSWSNREVKLYYYTRSYFYESVNELSVYKLTFCYYCCYALQKNKKRLKYFEKLAKFAIVKCKFSVGLNDSYKISLRVRVFFFFLYKCTKLLVNINKRFYNYFVAIT